MMACFLKRRKLTALIAGELSSREEVRLRAHLAACARCEQERLTLERMMAKLETLRAIAPSPGFEDRFWRKAREARPEGTPVRRYARPVPAWGWGFGLAAASVVVILVTARLYQGVLPPSVRTAEPPVSVEKAEIARDIDFYRNLELLESLGDLPETGSGGDDHNGTS